MPRCTRAATFAALSMLWCGASALAGSLRCQSVNGNINCAGPGSISCQTVDGKKVCVSGHGDVIQSFGKGSSSNSPDDDADDEGLDVAPPAPPITAHPNRHNPPDRRLLPQQEGAKPRLRADRLSIDRD